MKSLLLVVFVCLMIAACSKTASSTITGKWNVVSDSTIISGATVSYSIYNGTNGDHFTFSSNNILYIKEASLYDTFSYKLTSVNSISLLQTGTYIYAIPESGTYLVSGNKIRINVAPDLTNPGFSYERIINLER